MDGVLIVNKEKGYTSHDIVAKVKKILNQKVGHTGTLDPNATGVLPLLVGKGTLISKYLINHDKIYEAVLQLGIKTHTADIEGEIIEKKEVNDKAIGRDNIIKVFDSMKGNIKQTPPMYSAIKINGKKLYEYARKGESIDVKPRQITIYDMKLKDINVEKKEITFVISCSKGTYIRSVCEDIALSLDSIGYMKELKRLKVGEFNINNAIYIEDIENNKGNIEDYLITVEELFKHKQDIILAENELVPFLNGVKIKHNKEDDVYRIYKESNDFVGLGVINNRLLKRDVII